MNDRYLTFCLGTVILLKFPFHRITYIWMPGVNKVKKQQRAIFSVEQTNGVINITFISYNFTRQIIIQPDLLMISHKEKQYLGYPITLLRNLVFCINVFKPSLNLVLYYYVYISHFKDFVESYNMCIFVQFCDFKINFADFLPIF